MHKLEVDKIGEPSHKLSLDKESFFLIERIPPNSEFKNLIENKLKINFKEIQSKNTDSLLQKHERLYAYIKMNRP